MSSVDENLIPETLRVLRARRGQILSEIEAVSQEVVLPSHLPDHDLERFHLGMIEEPELSTVEQHLLWCQECVKRAEECASYVDTVRAAVAQGEF